MEWWLNLSFTSFADYLALAQAAERHGFAGVVLSDHLITPIDYDSTYPYAPADAPRWPVDVEWPDCWVTIAALAMGTTRLRFATAVYVAPLREPIALAKSIGTAAILSGYRLACGFGAGWLREEFDAVGVAFPSRGRRLDEMLTVMTTLWHGDSPGHAGDHFRHPAAVMHPRPQQHIPIYVGGHGEAALARAARHDGWIAAHQDAERTAAAMARLHRALEASDRDPEQFQVLATISARHHLRDVDALSAAGVKAIAVPAAVLSRSAALDDRLESLAQFSDQYLMS
jgi:probable F420-dependent oxidoreductase